MFTRIFPVPGLPPGALARAAEIVWFDGLRTGLLSGLLSGLIAGLIAGYLLGRDRPRTT